MATLNETKRRIKSVNSIIKVTKAMYLVAATRMKKTQEITLRSKDYSNKINEITQTLSLSKESLSPYMDTKYSPSKDVLLVVFSTQRGLAGSLPTNMFKYALQKIDELEKSGKTVKAITVGKKIGYQLISKKVDVIADFSTMPEIPTSQDTRALITLINDEYLGKKVSEVHVIYPDFINTMTQKPSSMKFLPIDGTDLNLAKSNKNFIYEPSQSELLEVLIRLYLESQIYKFRVEAVSSEYSARMIAMKSANDNSIEIKSDLLMEYNKSRQAQITQELAEITSAINKNG